MLKQFPSCIRAGLSLRAIITSADYPAPDWTVKAHLRGATSINLTATGDGDAHTFSATGATTASYQPGRYVATIRATKGDDVFEIEAGEIQITADVAALDDGHDPRAHAEKVLAAIEAVLEKRATKDQESYTINGRSLTRTSIADLMELRKTYRAEVARLKGNGRHKKLVRRKVRVSF